MVKGNQKVVVAGRTPEEAKANAEANFQFIKQREKLAALNNIKSKEAGKILADQAPVTIQDRKEQAIRDKIEQEKLDARIRAEETLKGISQNAQENAQGIFTDITNPEEKKQSVGGRILDITQTLGAGAAGATTGAGVGAGIGAAVAGIPTLGIGVPVGAAVGGAIGGIAGFATGTLTEISLDKKQDVKEANTVGITAAGNIEQLINDANAGKITPARARSRFNEEVSNLYLAKGNLHKLNNGLFGSKLSRGLDEEARLNGFLRNLPDLQREMYFAIITPDPNKVKNIVRQEITQS